MTSIKKAVLITGIIISLFVVPYITIPGLIIWWFYKKSKFTKRTKVLTTSGVGGLFSLLIVFSVFAYANDEVPTLQIIEPENNTTIQSETITIKGTYQPPDRTVWINDEEIPSSNGKFETDYKLKVGENQIKISAGNWKRANANLTITRELSEEEKAALVTPTVTPTLTPTSKPTTKATATPTRIPTKIPTPTKVPTRIQLKPTATPTVAPKTFYNSGSGGTTNNSGTTNSVQGYSCGSKTTCGEMTSCSEARYYLNSCGLSRLDGDSDGTPCESICE